MTTFLTILGWVLFLVGVICAIIAHKTKDEITNLFCGYGCIFFCICAFGCLICEEPKEIGTEKNQTFVECNEEEKNSSNYNVNNTYITNKEYSFSFDIDFSIFK